MSSVSRLALPLFLASSHALQSPGRPALLGPAPQPLTHVLASLSRPCPSISRHAPGLRLAWSALHGRRSLDWPDT